RCKTGMTKLRYPQNYTATARPGRFPGKKGKLQKKLEMRACCCKQLQVRQEIIKTRGTRCKI
ncbi:MAG TPA: hypothetical protein PK341_17090, partial [Spirochaetota bacterium]|nr:hypothetical protein [Spirochaetota bacterium]